MPISEDRRKELVKRIKKARTSKAPENAVGQWIASFFEAGVTNALKNIIEQLPGYSLSPPHRRRTWRLPNIYGEERQIDHVISDNNHKPIIIIEDKWLKDQRHLKDKGSWIIAMEAVQKANPSIRAIIAILAGEWNISTISALRKVAHVFHIPTETVYKKLKSIGVRVKIDKEREAFEDPSELLEDILITIEKNLPERDIITELGKEIVEQITPGLRHAIQEILFPKEPERSQIFEFSVATNWGRIYRITDRCIEMPPNEILKKVQESIKS